MREIAKMTKLHDLAEHKRYAHEVPDNGLLYRSTARSSSPRPNGSLPSWKRK